MKSNNFNKLGDTSLRTKVQVINYFQILNWIIETKENNDPITKDKWNEEFISLCKNENIYCYKNNSINRFQFVLKELKNWKILNDNCELIDKKDKSELLRRDIYPFQFFFSKIVENYLPFKKIVEFLYEKKLKEENVEIDRLIYCFYVYGNNNDNDETTESIQELYEMGKEDILDSIANKNIKNYQTKKDEYGFNFKKPPKYIKLYTSILNYYAKIKLDGLKKIFQNITFKKSDEHILTTLSKKNNKVEIIEKLEKMKLNDYLLFIEKERLKRLLDKEYKDLFLRWLKDFKLINNFKDKNIKLNFLEKEYNKFYIRYKQKPEKYPFTFEEVTKFISYISNRKFHFKNSNKMLENIEDSTLAEYFVNLFISMKIKIPPSKFNEFCNTQMDEKLFPIFTARGGKADFQYIDKKNEKVIVVETTIIKTESSITKVEFEPIARHFLNYVEENDATKYKHVLIFVSYYKNEWMTKLMDWTIERGMQELWQNDKNLNCKVSKNIRFDELFNIEV
ncbi:hypothetical protein [Metamycoplasma hyosynoviae]|uniref:hypothetical protein n=1 Tax=Metamycoplasma hyosynoviae TaxID=29559 RepID=UPI0023584482|nr:hypothetical protein [Metamycoplasma hyosynoviae]MDC8962387.1 hypothetical protein [Metamycoplasma hyosynoviae]